MRFKTPKTPPIKLGYRERDIEREEDEGERGVEIDRYKKSAQRETTEKWKVAKLVGAML